MEWGYDNPTDADKIFYRPTKKLYKKVVARSARDLKFRNDILSFSYIWTEHGPSITASGVTALILRNGESWLQIFGAIAAGILLKHYGRKYRDVFMDDVRGDEGYVKSARSYEPTH